MQCEMRGKWYYNQSLSTCIKLRSFVKCWKQLLFYAKKFAINFATFPLGLYIHLSSLMLLSWRSLQNSPFPICSVYVSECTYESLQKIHCVALCNLIRNKSCNTQWNYSYDLSKQGP